MERTAADFLPERLSLGVLRNAAEACRGCDLYRLENRTVFGEGPASAHLVLVGEQPGDREDRAGRPFVGPAGRVLDEALEAGGIPREDVYVTNAVKHFKYRVRGKRRLHARPTDYEVRACRPWLEAELAVIDPRVLVLLGATAAQSLLGTRFRVTAHRREPLETEWAAVTFATIHPSALLRIDHEADRRAAREAYLEELCFIGEHYRRALAH
jgi:uracil-DNA glycosylase